MMIYKAEEKNIQKIVRLNLFMGDNVLMYYLLNTFAYTGLRKTLSLTLSISRSLSIYIYTYIYMYVCVCVCVRVCVFCVQKRYCV